MDKKDINDNLKLMYVLKVGENFYGEKIFEFIFSKNIINIDPKLLGWGEFPAKENANPPDKKYVSGLFELKTDITSFEVLHESEQFTYLDGCDRVIAIAWEEITEDNEDLFDEIPRLVFHYGDTFKDVESKLYGRDLRLVKKN
jgi:hypothetical protein